MADVVLIRPGCTDYDEQNRIQGSLDLPLSARGQEQVKVLVQQLRGLPLDVIVSAPSEPVRSTAIAVSEQCGAALKEQAEFRNLNHGLWEGLQVDDVRRKYPKVFKQWQESPETVCLPEGETVGQAVERVHRGLRKCVKRRRNVGIVASEPLATLIGCVLSGSPFELPESAACTSPEQRIEIFRLVGHDGVRWVMTPHDTELPAHAGPADESGPPSVENSADAQRRNGQARNGDTVHETNGRQNGRKTPDPTTPGPPSGNGKTIGVPAEQSPSGLSQTSLRSSADGGRSQG